MPYGSFFIRGQVPENKYFQLLDWSPSDQDIGWWTKYKIKLLEVGVTMWLLFMFETDSEYEILKLLN